MEKQQCLLASPDDYFGWSVSMLDDKFLVTARGEEDGQTAHAGKAFLFRRSDGANVGDPLQAPSPQPEQGFGWSSVSVRDNRILVTAATLQPSQQPGDLNGDLMVGSSDLDIIRANWGQYVTPGDLLAGDPSGDGFVGSADLDIIRANWGQSLPPAVAGSVYLFDAEDGRLLRTFAEPASAEYGFFGMSAAVVGDEVLVSAPNASLVISEDGAVYRFDMGITLTQTDASGDYSFTALDEGTYRIRQRPAEGYYQTAPAGPTTYTVEVTQQTQEFAGNDFGIGLDWLLLTCDALTEEGSAAVLTVTTNSNTRIESWQIDWGDGCPSSVTAPTSGFLPLDWGQGVVQVGNHRWEFTREGTYTADDATYAVAISANEAELPEGRLLFTVNNVAPTITLTGDETVNKDVSYTLTLADLDDPGQDTVQSYVVHWGDQQSDTYTAAQIAAAGGQVTHEYAIDPGDITITLDLVDEDGTHYGVAEKDLCVTLALTWDPDGVTDTSFEGSGNWNAASAWLDVVSGTRYQWDSQWDARAVAFLGNGGTVNINASATVESMDFELGGYILSGANTLTLTGGAITTGFLGVEISAPLAGSAGLDKRGSGTLTLSGTNTLTGNTTLTEGELRIDGSLASSPVTVLDGTLSGAGTAGDVTVEYGTLQPGGTAIGTLNTGDLTLSDRAVLAMELGASTRDLLDVTGTVDLGGAALHLGGTRANLDSEVLVLIDNDGTDAVVGTFAGLREGATVEHGGVLYLVTYKYDADTSTRGTGNDVALIDAVTLAAPSSVSAALAAGEYNEIDVSWADTQYETHFEIERNWNELGWEPVTTKGQNVTAHLDTGLEEFNCYRYRVRALDDQNPDKVSVWTTLHIESPVITRLSPTGDFDNDGLSNADEVAAGTIPVHFDTDGDGFSDGWEYLYSPAFDPLTVQSQSADADSDGLTNLQEYNWGTNPTATDSDGDGVSDYIEAVQGSDPRDAGDGGLGLPEDMISRHQILVGDATCPVGHAPSELWAIDVGPYRCVQPGYYTVGVEFYLFETGETYPITLEHLSTDPNFLENNGYNAVEPPWYPERARFLPNYDWEAGVCPAGFNDTLPHYVDDPVWTAPAIGWEPAHEYRLLDNGVTGHHWAVLGEPNLPEGKTAQLIIPQLDVDVDSKNDSGFDEPTDNVEEDRIELDGTKGKFIVVNNGDVDGDGIIDYNDFDDGITNGVDDQDDGRFVPMAVWLSENVAAAGLENVDDITLRFDYPSGIRLWMPGKDAREPRTEHDIIPSAEKVALSKFGVGLEDLGNPIIVYIEGLAPSYQPRKIEVFAEVKGTNVQWTAEENGALKDTVYVEVISIDIDTDSDNDGGVERNDAEEVLEDVKGNGVGQVGKRIFVNRDDDNMNGKADIYDRYCDYTFGDLDPNNDYEDNDFAAIKFDVGVDLSRFQGHYLYLIASKGLDVWASPTKIHIVSNPAQGFEVIDADDTPTSPPAEGQQEQLDQTDDVYRWQITGPYYTFPTREFYVEGTDVGRQTVKWQLRKPDGTIVVEDMVEINVEEIVWPFATAYQVKPDESNNLVANPTWYDENTENWEGFALTDAWYLGDSALIDYIKDKNPGTVATVHPNLENGTACSTGDPLSPINGDYTSFDNGFTLEFDYQFEPNRGDGTTGWVKIVKGGDRFKISNVGNSGVKFGELPPVGEETEGKPLEAAILDVVSMAAKAGGIATLKSYVEELPDGAEVDFPDGLNPTYETEPVNKLMTGVLYGGLYPNMKDSPAGATMPFTKAQYEATLQSNWDRANRGENDSMTIDVTKTLDGLYTITIYLGGETVNHITYTEAGIALQSLNDIALQTHWGSGVVFSNMRLTKK